MSSKRNRPLRLTEEQRERLEGLIACGNAPARQLAHARILLSRPTRGLPRMLPAKPGLRYEDRRCSADQPLDGPSGARAVRKGGPVETALVHRKPVRTKPKKLDGSQEEAHLIALACSEAPEGRGRSGSVRLLAERFVRLEGAEEEPISRE